MGTRRFSLLVVLAFVGLSYGADALTSPTSRSKKSKSDADTNAIGHRNIVHNTNVNFYSAKGEKELGKSLSQELERTSKLLKNPAITDFIGHVAQNLANNSDAHFPITVGVTDTSALTAFTLPGGYQYVSRGLLLQLEDEGELASVLARGIAHTALRSYTRLATKGQILKKLASIPIVPLGTGGSTGNGVDSANSLGILKMRRDDELDADYFGVQYLYKAGYDPKNFIDFVQLMWGTNSTAGDELPKILSAFPPLDERVAALLKEISKIPAPRAAVNATQEFDTFKERLRSLPSE
jgi:predicted Zn-dependent protease